MKKKEKIGEWRDKRKIDRCIFARKKKKFFQWNGRAMEARTNGRTGKRMNENIIPSSLSEMATRETKRSREKKLSCNIFLRLQLYTMNEWESLWFSFVVEPQTVGQIERCVQPHHTCWLWTQALTFSASGHSITFARKSNRTKWFVETSFGLCMCMASLANVFRVPCTSHTH